MRFGFLLKRGKPDMFTVTATLTTKKPAQPKTPKGTRYGLRAARRRYRLPG